MAILFDGLIASGKSIQINDIAAEIDAISQTNPTNLQEILLECYQRNLFNVALVLAKVLAKMSGSISAKMYKQFVSRALAVGANEFVGEFAACFPDILKHIGTYFPAEFKKQLEVLQGREHVPHITQKRHEKQHHTLPEQQKGQEPEQQKGQEPEQQKGQEPEQILPSLKHYKLVKVLLQQQKLLPKNIKWDE